MSLPFKNVRKTRCKVQYVQEWHTHAGFQHKTTLWLFALADKLTLNDKHCKTSVARRPHLEILAQLAAALLNDLILVKLAKAKMAFIDTWAKMAISYHLNIKLGEKPVTTCIHTRSLHLHRWTQQIKSTHCNSRLTVSICLLLINYKVTFVLKAQSGAEEMGGEGSDASTRLPHNSLSNTFTSQRRGGRSWLEVLDGAERVGERGDDGVRREQGERTRLSM